MGRRRAIGGLAGVALLVLVVMLGALAGCSNPCRDHAVGTSSCDGNTLVGYTMDDKGDLPFEIECGSKFCRADTTSREASCAIRPDPEPACMGAAGQACNAAGERIECGPGGYVGSVLACGAPDQCLEDRDRGAFCVPAGGPDLRCPQPPADAPFACAAGHLLHCHAGYSFKDTDCGGPDLCYTPAPGPTASSPVEEARCVPSASVDLRCTAISPPAYRDPRIKDGCDGARLFHCLDDLLTSSYDCPNGCIATGGFAACKN